MRHLPLRILQIAAVCILIGGFYWPLLNFFSGKNPLNPEENFLNWVFFLEFFSDPWNLRVIGFSFYQAFLSAILSILVGLPGAWLLTHFDFPGKNGFRLLMYLPFILPSILVVLAIVLFFGNNGWINRALMSITGSEEPPLQFLYSLSGILIAHVFYNFPLAMKIISEQWERISVQYLSAAQTLGAGTWRRALGITLPLLAPSLASSFVLIFILCLNSFAIILVLGGGIRFTTIEVLIYQLARIELDFSGAVSLAILQAGMSLLGMAFLLRGSESQVKQQSQPQKNLISALKNGRPAAWFGFVWFMLLLIFAFGPLLAMILDSLRKFENGEWVYTLHWYKELFQMDEENRFLHSLWNSLKIATGSASLASLMGIGFVSLTVYQRGLKRRFWEILTLFPIVLSTVVFGIAWYYLYQGKLDGGIPLILVIMVMHALLTAPYWIRVVLPTLESIPVQWHLESKMLGKSELEFALKILWPWLKKTILIAFFFSFSLSLGEINSTMMVTDDSIRTLPLEIYNAISGYQFEYASAVGVVLLLLSVSFFLLIEGILKKPQ